MYDAFSNDYDRFVNWQARLAGELPFLERQLAGVASQDGEVRVLDAACGTGMHAISLAQRGHQCAGADLSPRMIDRARENAIAAGVDVDFAAVGFGDLAQAFESGSTKPVFDAVLCLGNSLPHLLTLEELSAALHDFAACLRHDGLLLIQNRNFDAVMSDRQRWMEPQSHREDEREWLFLRFYDFLPNGLIDFNIVTLTRDGNNPWSQTITTTRLRPLLRDEMVSALTAAGFAEVEIYGGLNGSDFDPATSGNLVVGVRKASRN